MNIVLIVPTGIGAQIGGHAGDANPVCKLLASLADTLITHPNVVNASDINEMPENVWYVEGSMLDRFLEGKFCLKRPMQNRILVATNAPVRKDTINAVSAARVTIGVQAEIVELAEPLTMRGFFVDGVATGAVTGVPALIDQVAGFSYDALALHTPIEVPREVALRYLRAPDGVNPWGGVEALASEMVARVIGKPVAHAPLESWGDDEEMAGLLFEEGDPRKAPEIISFCYLHSVLKGLHRAPRVSSMGLSVDDVDVLVSPDGCIGRPHEACLERGIPVIAVRENQTVEKKSHPSFIYVDNYWEAAGVIACMNAGVARSSVRRPLPDTLVNYLRGAP